MGMKKAMKKKAAAPAPKAMKAMKKAMGKAMKAAAPAPKAMKAMKKAMKAMKAMKKAMKKKAAAPAPKAMKAMKKAMKKKAAAAPAPKAMKAMRAMKAGALTQTGVFQSVADKCKLKTKDAKAVVEALMGIAASEIKKSGSFKFAGMLNMKLKNKPATKARKGINPFTKEPCVFKAKPASKTVKCFAMKKLKEML